MTDSQAKYPIGIFDSGIGGLTVAKAITNLLPDESLVYFGDTAHVPWGDKSVAAIQNYSLKICEVLLKHHCKIILIACNTASAAAFNAVQEYVGQRALVLNVIDPVVQHIIEFHTARRIGLIGTKQTVRLNLYQKKIQEQCPELLVASLATPLLVPLIEEGFLNKAATHLILQEYLQNPKLDNIDTLILGCTHYPLLKDYIHYLYPHIDIIDSAHIAAASLKQLLETNKLTNINETPSKHFYVSDDSEFFAATARIFFSSDIQLEHYPLWEAESYANSSSTQKVTATL